MSSIESMSDSDSSSAESDAVSVRSVSSSGGSSGSWKSSFLNVEDGPSREQVRNFTNKDFQHEMLDIEIQLQRGSVEQLNPLAY